MEELERLAIFRAQTQNVRELHKAWKQVNRQINELIRQKNHKAVQINTKILALIYCALAEAVFSKLLHTPRGLEVGEIEQIKNSIRENGVKAGWIKCAELSFRRVEGVKHNHQPNVLKRLTALIEKLIYDPSLIRNKLAHGQWCIALNRENTAVNEEITRELAGYTVVDFHRRRYSLERLAAILEDLVESPNRAHRRDYWTHLTELEAKEREQASWTVERKVDRLLAKQSFHPAPIPGSPREPLTTFGQPG